MNACRTLLFWAGFFDANPAVPGLAFAGLLAALPKLAAELPHEERTQIACFKVDPLLFVHSRVGFDHAHS